MENQSLLQGGGVETGGQVVGAGVPPSVGSVSGVDSVDVHLVNSITEDILRTYCRGENEAQDNLRIKAEGARIGVNDSPPLQIEKSKVVLSIIESCAVIVPDELNMEQRTGQVLPTRNIDVGIIQKELGALLTAEHFGLIQQQTPFYGNSVLLVATQAHEATRRISGVNINLMYNQVVVGTTTHPSQTPLYQQSTTSGIPHQKPMMGGGGGYGSSLPSTGNSSYVSFGVTFCVILGIGLVILTLGTVISIVLLIALHSHYSTTTKALSIIGVVMNVLSICLGTSGGISMVVVIVLRQSKMFAPFVFSAIFLTALFGACFLSTATAYIFGFVGEMIIYTDPIYIAGGIIGVILGLGYTCLCSCTCIVWAWGYVVQTYGEEKNEKFS